MAQAENFPHLDTPRPRESAVYPYTYHSTRPIHLTELELRYNQKQEVEGKAERRWLVSQFLS